MGNNEKDFKVSFLDIVNLLVPIAGGLFAIVILFVGNFSSVLGARMTPFENIFISMLGGLFAIMVIEKIKDKRDVADKLDVIKHNISSLDEHHKVFLAHFKDLPSYRVLVGINSIQNSTLDDIKACKKNVKATSFKPSGIIPEDRDDYYEALALNLKTIDHFKYSTAYNFFIELEQRKIVFKKMGLTESQYSRMTHYKFENQLYLNVLIIDEKIAYFGFPTNNKDRTMQVAIRISNVSHEGSEFVRELTHWYNSYIPTMGKEEDTLSLFDVHNC